MAGHVEKLRSPDAFHVFAMRPPRLVQSARPAPWHYVAGSASSDSAARAAAVAEAAERYSQSNPGGRDFVRASFRELGTKAIHPNDCMLYSDSQYESRQKWNRVNDPSCRVPQPFDDRRKIDWVAARSLRFGHERFLPAALVYLESDAAGNEMCVADTNGCAAGESVDDAIVRGFFEVIERDSIALWWYTRARRPAIDLASVRDPHVPAIVAAYADLGRDVWVLDLTTDTGIPCYAAVSRRTNGGPEQLLLGFGAGPDPTRAILHALAEMSQTVTLLGLRGDRPVPPSQPLLRDWLATATTAAHEYIVPSGSAVVPAAIDPAFAENPVEGVWQTLERLDADLFSVDLAHQHVGVPVAKVFVPGLRPAAPRFAAGRLFRVPQEIGWRQAPFEEKDLTSTPFFL